MLTKEYLDERIAHHVQKAQEHVMAADRSAALKATGSADEHLRIASEHAAIFTALTAIAAGKQ